MNFLFILLAVFPLIPSRIHRNPVPANLKIAFVADMSVSINAVRVLELIHDEKADFVIHQGDLGYEAGVDDWLEMMEDILGEDFPYFVSIGNREFELGNDWFDDYLPMFEKRPEYENCEGELGVNMICDYKGVLFILSAVGEEGDDHVEFALDEFEEYYEDYRWKICSWHRNERDFQIDYKDDEIGYDMYETCLDYGAFIVTGHGHVYSRTYLMSSYEEQEIESKDGQDWFNPMQLKEGSSFLVSNGCGGRNIRDYQEDLVKNKWWAAYGGAQNSWNFGANFCTLNIDGYIDRMECVYKDIEGNIRDEFHVQSFAGSTASSETTSELHYTVQVDDTELSLMFLRAKEGLCQNVDYKLNIEFRCSFDFAFGASGSVVALKLECGASYFWEIEIVDTPVFMVDDSSETDTEESFPEIYLWQVDPPSPPQSPPHSPSTPPPTPTSPPSSLESSQSSFDWGTWLYVGFTLLSIKGGVSYGNWTGDAWIYDVGENCKLSGDESLTAPCKTDISVTSVCQNSAIQDDTSTSSVFQNRSDVVRLLEEQACECSNMTCEELYLNPSDRGSPLICGETDYPFGGCSGQNDYTNAVKFCEAGGMRLCTLSELENNEVSDTGCGYDQVLVWTSVACEIGYWAAATGTMESDVAKTACVVTDSNGIYVRCCADVEQCRRACEVSEPEESHLTKPPPSSCISLRSDFPNPDSYLNIDSESLSFSASLTGSTTCLPPTPMPTNAPTNTPTPPSPQDPPSPPPPEPRTSEPAPPSPPEPEMKNSDFDSESDSYFNSDSEFSSGFQNLPPIR